MKTANNSYFNILFLTYESCQIASNTECVVAGLALTNCIEFFNYKIKTDKDSYFL